MHFLSTQQFGDDCPAEAATDVSFDTLHDTLSLDYGISALRLVRVIYSRRHCVLSVRERRAASGRAEGWGSGEEKLLSMLLEPAELLEDLEHLLMLQVLTSLLMQPTTSQLANGAFKTF